MSKIAIIGTREPSREKFELLRDIAAYLARKGHTIATGGAYGCDQAAMEGASSVNPQLLQVFLPWVSYNKEIVPANCIVFTNQSKEAIESVKIYHPAYDRLTQGALKLHARNYDIINGCKYVIALPSHKPGGGGTGQGIRIATDMRIKLYNMLDDAICDKFIEMIY
jgi:predicted Rossmann-fold nucleotide-binding protein